MRGEAIWINFNAPVQFCWREAREADTSHVNRLLHIALNLVIMGSIVVLCAVSLMLTHWGVLRLIAGASRSGGTLIAFAAGLALAAMFMIRNRNDLADR